MKKVIFLLLVIVSFIHAKDRSYPVQEVNFGAYNTTYNLNITGSTSGSSLNISPADGTEKEDWRINYISNGVYEIENSYTGDMITENSGAVTIEIQTNSSSQQWNIIGVDKDFLGEYLYYKIVNVSTGKALTTDGTSIKCESYTGANSQKWRIDLDGLEGFAAMCKVKEGVKASAIGGLLGPTVFVSNLTDFTNAIKDNSPKTVVVTANMEARNLGDAIQIGSYTTVIGSFAANNINDIMIRNNAYGWNWNGSSPGGCASNIIYKNMNFTAKYNEDHIILQFFSCDNIWIDHVTFNSTLPKNRGEVGKFIWINTPYKYSDSNPGPDYAKSPDFITVSYSSFTNRYWCFAYGTQNGDLDKVRTTVCFNNWDSNIRRTPQIGNGSLHNYNNFYVRNTSSDEHDGYATIIGGDNSIIYSESNRFENFKKETTGYWDIEFTVSTNEQFVDYNSYTNKSESGSSSVTPYKWTTNYTYKAVTMNPKNLYGYKRLNAYNSNGSNDTKAFVTKYNGYQSSSADFKYITDADMNSYVAENVANPFLVTPQFDPVTYTYVEGSSNSWDNTANWTPNGTPSNIDSAIIKTGEAQIESDISANIDVQPNGILRAKGYFKTPNITLNGGTIKVYTSGTTYGLSGKVKVNAASTILAGSTASSPFLCDLIFSGKANLTKTSVGILQLQKSSPDFSGNWTVVEGKLRTKTSNAVGSGNVTIKSGALLDLEAVDGLKGCDSLILEEGASVSVDAASDEVTYLKISDKVLSPGTYSAADYPKYISGVGKLTVKNGPANQPATVTLTTPVDNDSSYVDSTVVLKADATDDYGVEKVVFYVTNTATMSMIPVGADSTAPYSFNWIPTEAAKYYIVAKATDTHGEVSNSNIITYSVLENKEDSVIIDPVDPDTTVTDTTIIDPVDPDTTTVDTVVTDTTVTDTVTSEILIIGEHGGSIVEALPNPMTSNGFIRYDIKNDGALKLVIYDNLGRKASVVRLSAKVGKVMWRDLHIYKTGVYTAVIYNKRKEQVRVQFYY